MELILFMKYGVRKPSVKKSISARTTGKIKRQVKSSVDPLYGKKGMGVINDPNKAAYNAVYDRTTVGVSDLVDDNAQHNDEHISVFSAIGAFFQILWGLLQLVFWGAIVIGLIYFIVKVILW
jgi:hypothetical protein